MPLVTEDNGSMTVKVELRGNQIVLSAKPEVLDYEIEKLYRERLKKREERKE